MSAVMSMKQFPVGVKLKDLERQAILAAIDATGGSTTSAARMLGISVRKVQYRLHAYGRAPRRDVPSSDDSDGESTPPPA